MNFSYELFLGDLVFLFFRKFIKVKDERYKEIDVQFLHTRLSWHNNPRGRRNLSSLKQKSLLSVTYRFLLLIFDRKFKKIAN